MLQNLENHSKARRRICVRVRAGRNAGTDYVGPWVRDWRGVGCDRRVVDVVVGPRGLAT